MVKPGAAVFVDTSAWYALFVATDPKHGDATVAYDRLKRELVRLHTTDWVLLESAALLHARAGGDLAREASGALLANTQVSVFWMDEDAGRAAVERYRAAPKAVSLVDAGSFVAMDRLNLKRAFAFDDDFQAQGYAPCS